MKRLVYIISAFLILAGMYEEKVSADELVWDRSLQPLTLGPTPWRRFSVNESQLSEDDKKQYLDWVSSQWTSYPKAMAVASKGWAGGIGQDLFSAKRTALKNCKKKIGSSSCKIIDVDGSAAFLKQKNSSGATSTQLAKKKVDEGAARQLAKKKAEKEAAIQLAKKKAEEEVAKKAYASQLAEARTQALQAMISAQSELMRHLEYPDRLRVEDALGLFTQSIAGDDLALIQSTQEKLLAEVALMVGHAEKAAAELAQKKNTEEEAAAQLAQKKEEDAAAKLAQAEFKNKQDATTAVDKSLELEFWQAIKNSNDADMFKEYLRQFPQGLYSGLAKLKLNKLDADAPTVVNPAIPNLDYGDYYALVIGNNRYEHLQNLRTAVDDARDVANLLEVDYGFNIELLENANRAQIVKSISGLRGKISKKDNVLIYYAGHGYLDEGADEGFWLPVDASPDDPSNWIMTDRIVSQVRAMEAKHVMIVADSCFSGTLTRGLKIEQRTPEWLKTIVKKKSRTALTSGGLEPVSDSGGGENSIFAYSFLSILKDNDGVLDASRLFRELKPKVMMNSEQTPEYGDIHKSGHDGGDFLFVRQ